MPKVVDVEQRRQEIAAALLRVAARDGLAATSVRAVGKEAGISAGALRHYFTTQDELLVFALDMLEQTVREDLAHADHEDPMERATAVLGSLIATDERSRQGCRIWFEAAALSPTRPVVQPAFERTRQGMLTVCGQLVGDLMPEADTRTCKRESELLAALLDGLALRGSYEDPPQYDRYVQLLREYLSDLVSTADAAQSAARRASPSALGPTRGSEGPGLTVCDGV